MTNASVQNWKKWGYERENVMKDLGGSGREEGGGRKRRNNKKHKNEVNNKKSFCIVT